MNHKILLTLVAALALFLPAVPAAAQRVPNSGPISPVGPVGNSRSVPVAAGRNVDAGPDASQVQPDTHTLSSIESIGSGTLGIVESIFDPSFSFTQSRDTAILPGIKTNVSTLGANLGFNHQWSRAQLTGAYNGAQALYYPDSSFNTANHNLGVVQQFTFSRWLIRLRDDLTVAPDAPFGGLDGGGGALAAMGQYGLHDLNGAMDDIDAVLTQRAKRIRNMAAAEVNYSLSRRSIVTAAGQFTTTDFSQPGFVESQGINGRVGYDYVLSSRNVIGLMYAYDRTNFTNPTDRTRTDSVQMAFGRRIAGRLAFQIAGGPQMQRSLTQGRNLTWTLTSSMNYGTRRNQYNLSYGHVFSRGSGVFLGASRHTVVATMQRALSGTWTSFLAGGYARNENLTPAPGVVELFSNYYATAGVGRAAGRHLQFNFNYGIQRQIAGAGACPVQACGATQTRHVFGVTLQWHPWTIVQ